jgi:hypothetical protein
LKKSGVAGDKERLKGTQSINKSLSALGMLLESWGRRGINIFRMGILRPVVAVMIVNF